MPTDASTTSRPRGLNTDLPWCLNDQHREWRQTVRAFCADVVGPTVGERNVTGTFDESLVDRIAELGVFGLRIPAEYGGAGADLTSLCLAIEEIARIDSGLAATVHVAAIGGALLDHLGSEEQKREILPRAARGGTFICFGLTEPSSGSDAGNISTRARRDGDEWVINGAKQFITNAGAERAEYVILFAATGDAEASPMGARRPPVSAFLVPMGTPGFTVAPTYPKLGWRSSDTHPLFFDDVRVPDSALLGEEGRGYREALAFLTWARLPIASMSVGLGQACLDLSLEFIGDRESFGKTLGAHQGVAFSIADIATMVACARTITYDACFKHDNGYPYSQEAALCKLAASELANRAAYKATQIHGGYGFVEESDVVRHYRDARILTIGEGTSEVQKMLIARSLGLPL